MNRTSFITRRLLQMIPVAIGVTVLVFFMIHLIPGDPAGGGTIDAHEPWGRRKS